MTSLVVGGAGYIGSHVVDCLVAAGEDVVVFDNLSSGYRPAIHPAAEFIQGDLLDRSALRQLFAAHDFSDILHFASYIQVGESMRDPFKYLRGNLLGSMNLLEAATAAGVQNFVFSSSANVYAVQERPICEDDRIAPGSVYGETKWAIERQLRWLEDIYGLRSVSLRYFNAAGAHPRGHIGEAHDPETHLIPLALQVALGQRESLQLYGDDYDTEDGTCVRDYVHVLDLADAHLLALHALRDNHPSCVYNIGSGRGYSVREVVEVARRVTEEDIPLELAPRRFGDVARLVADSERIRSELGWQPCYPSLEEMVATAWRWHSGHPQGYRDVEGDA